MDLIFALALLSSAAPCEGAADALVRRVESMPMSARAGAIALAFQRDETLGCGVVHGAFWTKAPELPVSCSLDRLESCAELGPVEVSRELVRAVDAVTYARVQRAAQALDGAGAFGPAHRRLFQIWLLSSALAREEARSPQ